MNTCLKFLMNAYLDIMASRATTFRLNFIMHVASMNRLAVSTDLRIASRVPRRFLLILISKGRLSGTMCRFIPSD